MLHHLNVTASQSVLLGAMLGLAALAHSAPSGTAAQDLVTAITAGTTHTITGHRYVLFGQSCRGRIEGLEELLTKRAERAAEFQRRLARVIPRYRERARREIGVEAERTVFANAQQAHVAYVEQSQASLSNASTARKVDCARTPS